MLDNKLFSFSLFLYKTQNIGIMNKIIVAGLLGLGLSIASIDIVNAQTVSKKACEAACCVDSKVKAESKTKKHVVAPMYKSKRTYKRVATHHPTPKSYYQVKVAPSRETHVMREARLAAAYERNYGKNDVAEVAKERTHQLHKKVTLTPSQERKVYKIYKKEAKKEQQLKELRKEHRQILKEDLTHDQWRKVR